MHDFLADIPTMHLTLTARPEGLANPFDGGFDGFGTDRTLFQSAEHTGT